ncbi:DUF6961 family protein [Sphingobium yanoikuyae]|uniref:DUF6961 family protein n=1 Tax=Sphingobium yanoikuyae TaxID=13690 RepID=UPI003917E60F
MLDDRDLWAAAQEVIEQNRRKAPAYVDQRIGELAAEGDLDGVQAWQVVAERVDQLMDHRTGRPLTRQ